MKKQNAYLLHSVYPLLLMAITLATLLLSLWLLTAFSARAATPAMNPTDNECQSVTAATANECKALAALYRATNGPDWVDQTNWLSFDSSAPCQWFGVQCTDGHVTELALAANGLSGTLPITIGYLSNLKTLHLDNNHLRGRIPTTICALLPNGADLNLAYNGLNTLSARTRACLNQLDPDWTATQTVAPRNLVITEFYTTSLRLSWAPILYTADGGYYELYASTNIDGPFNLQGTTADKQVDNMLATGLTPGQRYFFVLKSYTPPHGEQMNALRSLGAKTVGVTKAINGNVVVAAYFPADNDLSSQIRYVSRRFRLGTQLNPNVTVLLLVDGSGADDSKVLHIQDGVITVTSAVQDEWGSSELDTSDPATLTWFLHYVRQNYPATKTIVSLMGHGLAMAPEVDWPQPAVATTPVTIAALTNSSSNQFPPLPRDWVDTPSDVTNNSYMSTIDVGEALMAATNNGADPFDLVYFDQCFQGNLDSLYEVRKTAEVFVASPNYAWLVAAYDKYITGFSPTLTAEEMATHIINPYEITLNNRHPNAIFWVRGAEISAIADAISNLGDALTDALADGQAAPIGNAVRQSQYVDTTQCGRRNLQLGPPDELIGIETFAKNLLSEFGPNDTYDVSVAVEQIRAAMANVEKLNRSGNPYIAPDEFWDYNNSLTILTPLPRNSPSGVAWRASIYRPDAPFTATWTLDPTQPVTVTKSLAFVQEGRWDEFLAQWFQKLTPTVGQWCNYIPPAQVLPDDTEPLTLTLALDDANQLSLAWTPTDDTSASAYDLYLKDPFHVSWVLTQTVAITQTNAHFPTLDPGSYEVQILARNSDEEFVAESNAAAIDVPTIQPPNEEKIYLPFVSR